MVRLAIDYEHASRTWWESGGQELWDGIQDGSGSNAVLVDPGIAESWLAEARKLPGWDDGPEYAPHPIRHETVEDDDPDI